MEFDNTLYALVIGGGGFIGSNLVDSLLSKGRKVRVLDLPYIKPIKLDTQNSNIERLEGNFGNIQDIRRALKNVNAVFHLVSTTQPQSSNDDPYFDIQSNLLATIQLLEQMRSEKNAPLIFVSSGGTIYGKPQQTPIPESHSTEPECSYGIVKLTIEKYLALYRLLHGIDYRILRLANPYGPGQEKNRTQGVIGAFLSRILKDQSLEVWGDGTVIRDYIFIDDAVAALQLVENYQGPERIFNIGSGCGHSILEIISSIESVSGKRADIHFGSKRKFDVPVSILDIQRAQKELNWEPKTQLKDGLHATLNWLKQ
jgi:UDP-glucose 4-epimerase